MEIDLIAGTLGAATISLASYRFRLLTAGGSFAQWILGSILLGVGGWQWTVPLLVFCLVSSLLSRMWKSRRSEAEALFSKPHERDAMQVLANGSVASLIVLVWKLTQFDSWYVVYLGTIAAATADTWATEIGTLSRSSPRLVTTMAIVERGRSGAITMLGSLAGFAGAGTIFCSGIPWLSGRVFDGAALSVLGGGVAGMLTDSILGATVQLQYMCLKCGKTTERIEHCGVKSVQSTGFSWLTNDAVNLVCTLIGGLTSFLLARLSET